MSTPKEITTDLIRQLFNTHVLVYAGDGHGRPGQLMLSSRDAEEAQRIFNAVLQVRDDRVTQTCFTCGGQGFVHDPMEGRGAPVGGVITCPTCQGTRRVKRATPGSS